MKRGGIADPNSSRSKSNAEKGTGKGEDGDGLNGKGGDANTNSVRGTCDNPFLDSKICVLDGTNLRQLIDGLCLCPPGIILPGQRQSKMFWKAISKALLEVCNIDLLTSDKIRSAGMLEVLQEKVLDKGAKILMKCLSNLPGKTVGEVVKKPQRFRLQFIRSLAELENDPDKKFLQNLENCETIGYETDLGNFPDVPPRRNKTTSL